MCAKQILSVPIVIKSLLANNFAITHSSRINYIQTQINIFSSRKICKYLYYHSRIVWVMFLVSTDMVHVVEQLLNCKWLSVQEQNWREILLFVKFEFVTMKKCKIMYVNRISLYGFLRCLSIIFIVKIPICAEFNVYFQYYFVHTFDGFLVVMIELFPATGNFKVLSFKILSPKY